MRDYDNNDYVEEELEVMYKDTEFGRYKPVSREENKKSAGNGYMRQETLNEPKVEIAIQQSSTYSQENKLWEKDVVSRCLFYVYSLLILVE